MTVLCRGEPQLSDEDPPFFTLKQLEKRPIYYLAVLSLDQLIGIRSLKMITYPGHTHAQ